MQVTQQYTLDLPLNVSANICRQVLGKFARKIFVDEDTQIAFEDPRNGVICKIGLESINPSTTVITIILEPSLRAAWGPFWKDVINKRMSEYCQEISINYENTKQSWQAEKYQAGLMCPTCKKLVPAGTRFCPDDGTPIAVACTKCGHGNTPDTKFCVNCGQQLQ